MRKVHLYNAALADRYSREAGDWVRTLCGKKRNRPFQLVDPGSRAVCSDCAMANAIEFLPIFLEGMARIYGDGYVHEYRGEYVR